MKLTPARRRMLEALHNGSLQRDALFMAIGSGASGYAPLRALEEAGLVKSHATGGYLNGFPIVVWCDITPAGRAALATKP